MGARQRVYQKSTASATLPKIVSKKNENSKYKANRKQIQNCWYGRVEHTWEVGQSAEQLCQAWLFHVPQGHVAEWPCGICRVRGKGQSTRLVS